MSITRRECEQYVKALVTAGQLAQNVRFKEEWEPKVTQVLAGLSDRCQKKLLQALSEYESQPWTRRNPEALKARLVKDWTAMVAEASGKAKDILVEMVRREAAAAAEALTLNGLATPMPEFARMHPDPEYWSRRLAAGEALDQAVARSFFKFMARAFAELNDFWLAEKTPAGTEERLAGLAQKWRGQLETIARTVLHAAANRTKQAVDQALA
jgi:hypothetical protein